MHKKSKQKHKKSKNLKKIHKNSFFLNHKIKNLAYKNNDYDIRDYIGY